LYLFSLIVSTTYFLSFIEIAITKHVLPWQWCSQDFFRERGGGCRPLNPSPGYATVPWPAKYTTHAYEHAIKVIKSKYSKLINVRETAVVMTKIKVLLAVRFEILKIFELVNNFTLH
jgi:hypothetical protein